MNTSLAQVRIARPRDRLAEVERFYTQALGLPVIYRFDDHAGYDGVMIGLPYTDHHLGFTSHIDGSPGPVPSREVVERLAAAGHAPVDAENPYWAGFGALTFEDPDGWRVVLVPGRVF